MEAESQANTCKPTEVSNDEPRSPIIGRSDDVSDTGAAGAAQNFVEPLTNRALIEVTMGVP
jgi:hypothetical protein